MASLSYVTGAHSFKAGVQQRWGWANDLRDYANADLNQRYRNGVPFEVQTFNTPFENIANVNADLGLFVQDTWTTRRLTLNPGLRYDYFNSSIPAQTAPAGRFVPARSFAGIDNVPNWKDVSVRMGAAFDLFGDGRTAVKGNVGRYIQSEGTGLRGHLQPAGVRARHPHLDRHQQGRHCAGKRARTDQQHRPSACGATRTPTPTSRVRISGSTTSASSASCGRGWR